MKEVSIYDFYNIFQTGYSIRIIDVRDAYVYEQFHIPGAKNIPLDLLKEKYFLFLNPHNHYYLICKNGSLSIIASRFLSEHGYNVTNIFGGIDKWQGRIIKSPKVMVTKN